ncbi:hypothetical protein B0H65DRAFT_198509 [Neurospora tetraspora]|uniref:Uncharacterized protein n=1 Tax=Neurospora tetraspora TaxID=94610 RepID=A0AAE0MSE2_9PEZI|nr:hypothetical protein B0H65DRAFT_198509 [Neurospora tetraspora]
MLSCAVMAALDAQRKPTTPKHASRWTSPPSTGVQLQLETYVQFVFPIITGKYKNQKDHVSIAQHLFISSTHYHQAKKPKKCKKNRSRHLHLNALSQTPSDRNPARHLTVKMPLQSGTSLKCHLHCLGPRAASRRLPVRVGDHRKVRAGRRWASRFGHGIETLRKSSAFKPTLTITVESVVVRSNTYTPNQGSGGSGRHLVGATVG